MPLQIILVLIQKWLEQSARMMSTPQSPRISRSMTAASLYDGFDSYRNDRHSYQIINSTYAAAEAISEL